jgi:hypothetical protein
VQGQIIQTLEIGFEKNIYKKHDEESVSGRIYYRFPDHVCMIINDPVDQWIFSGIDSMVIYYPMDSLAFKFKTMFPVTFPFFQAFLGIVQEDYGLSSIGYTLTEHSMDDSLLTTIWSPPEEAPDEVGMFILTYSRDKLIYAEYKMRDGKVLSRTHYRNHIEHGVYFFPMEIEKFQYTPKDTIRETITYCDPHFNCTLPDSLMNFQIPSHVITEHIAW